MHSRAAPFFFYRQMINYTPWKQDQPQNLLLTPFQKTLLNFILPRKQPDMAIKKPLPFIKAGFCAGSEKT